ncbi:PREDICTED: translation initiation factor IF-2, mitochondrial-like [Branchiostoma belcheri]|uniref:Translation initiation factor IF-2, mitochondrial-like n=1 Tax=Branchiostoma belcheri TaxID=7741 RepID=A0A6P4Z2C5_BRABE|nr:PREDICTED: translation initiation factor IF-2, mitochondrial-like [Branchiostoma belcheri]
MSAFRSTLALRTAGLCLRQQPATRTLSTCFLGFPHVKKLEDSMEKSGAILRRTPCSCSSSLRLLGYGYSLGSYRSHFPRIHCARGYAKKARAERVPVRSADKKVRKQQVPTRSHMTVRELARAMGKTEDHVYECLLDRDDINDLQSRTVLDAATIRQVVKMSGMVAVPMKEHEEKKKEIKDAVRRPPPDPSVLVRRPPVVTIMGHVDHGKTTLLDSLRKSHIVAGEAGGITQHIGAFSVKLPTAERITFLDTPGHAAFSALRARGALVTDIVVLVVAADDGVMEQTLESIKHAQAADVPIIVAINKCDKKNSDPEVVMRELLSHGMELEEFGGDIQSVNISALKGEGLTELAEAIVTQAEVMEVKGDNTGPVEATVIESRTDKGKGYVWGNPVNQKCCQLACRDVFGSIEAIMDTLASYDCEEDCKLKDLPSAGDLILEVETESRAHEVVSLRLEQKKEQKLADDQVEIDRKTKEHLEHYQAVREATKDLRRWQQKKVKYEEFKPTPGSEKVRSTEPELNIVIRGDVFGSIEAIMDTLASYDCEEDCKLKVIHADVGAITESDIEMAAAFDGLVYGFNSTVPKDVAKLAEQKNVPVKIHKIIYRLFEDLKEELSAKLPTKEELDIKGSAHVLQVFEVTVGKKKVPVAGCRVTQGEMDKRRDALLVRNGEVIFRGPVSSLKHLKDDVWTVRQEMECGIALHKCPDIRHGDVIQSFEVNEVPQTIDWNPGF